LALNLVTRVTCQLFVVLVMLDLHIINVDEVTRQIRLGNPTRI
jgi:hypothetical protein